MGWTEEDMAEGSLDVVVLGERSAPVPLTPFVARGGVQLGMSRREGLAVLGACGEPSLSLTSVGSNSPMWSPCFDG